MSAEAEDLQSLGGGRVLPPTPPLSAEAVTDALARQTPLEVVDLTKTPSGEKPQVPSPIPHGVTRISIAGVALAICLIGPCTPWVPDDIKTAYIALAGAIATSLFKGLERY